MDIIDTKRLYESGKLRIDARMLTDPDPQPEDQDFASDEHREDFLGRFYRSEFIYVGMQVTATWHHVELGSETLWGIEHGDVSTDTHVTAWENTPPQYYTNDDGTPVTIGGSALNDVVQETLAQARHFVQSITTAPRAELDAALTAAEQWANPNRPTS